MLGELDVSDVQHISLSRKIGLIPPLILLGKFDVPGVQHTSL